MRLPIVVALLCATAAVPLAAANLSADFNRLILRGGSEIPSHPDEGAIESIAVGDVDCNGNDDIAVGDPRASKTDDQFFEHGSVSIAFGDRFLGLAPGGQLIDQGSPGISGGAEHQDEFGFALAAADFDDDNCDDLAIGVPGEDVGDLTDAGAVAVLFGTPGGLDGARDLFLPPTGESGPSGPNADHEKGRSLATLQLTSADARPFLAIGTTGHRSGGSVDAGAVSIRRSSGGVLLGAAVAFVERTDYPFEAAPLDDDFGYEVAAGDFNDDGFDDLVASSSHSGLCAAPSLCSDAIGLLWVTYGAASVQNITREKITQDSPGVPGTNESGDFWGDALAVGDFNNDGRDDLAVGAKNEDLGTIEKAGAVTILYGSASGLLAAADSSISFDQSDFRTMLAETGDAFGASLAAGDFDRDGFDDLAIGSPFEAIGTTVGAGEVLIVYGSAGGIDIGRFQKYSLATAGMQGVAGASDEFADTLAVGDFNDDQVTDLAVGIRQRGDNVRRSIGALSLIFSSGDTVTTIQSINPATVAVGRPTTVTVRSRRLATGGSQLGRGTVVVSVTGGGSCSALLNNFGDGSCVLTPQSAGARAVTATYAGVIGYRPSVSAPAALAVTSLGDALFSNSFE